MTNVPDRIREAWADVYRLFDVSYGMDGSEQAWEQYWNRVNELIQKYGDEIPLLFVLEGTAKMIEFFVKIREKPKNESLPWRADEDYPYPKE